MKTTLLTAFLFFISITVNAQWTNETDVNTLVAESESSDMKAIGTSDGQTYVVFWKSVAAPTNFELRLQVLDVDGNPQLGTEGSLISDNIPMNTFTVTWTVTLDADDNLYVGVTGTGDESAHAFKLDIDGNHLWGTNGIVVGEGYSVTILPLSSGEAIVAWFPLGQGTMQKYDADGNAVWTSTQPIVSGASGTVPANLFELSNGDYTVVFHVLSFGVNSTLYAQRYNGEGAAQWGAALQLSNKTTVFNTTYSGTQDGDNVYYGYVGKSGTRFDSFVQRINPDGTLPWGINGMDFDVNETDYEMDTKVAISSGSAFVWAVSTYTNSNQSQRGEYVQKFDKETGARQFTENAKVVFPISDSDNVHASDLYLVNDTPFFLQKSGLDNGATPVTLNAVLLDENGDFAWAEETKPVATYAANKSRVHLTRPINNQAVAVFVEDKTTGNQMYAQNFTDFGTISLPSAPTLISPADGSTGIPLMTTFTWSAATGADNYQIQIAEDAAFATIIVDESELTNTSFDNTLPANETTYFWRVKSSNTDGESEWTATWSFTTEMSTGTENLEAEYQLKVYPNPASNFVSIGFNSPISSEVNLAIYNSQGKMLIATKRDINYGSNLIELNTDFLPAGTYVYEMKGEGLELYGKFAVVK